MVKRTFADLVQDLKQRRIVGDRPPVLVLGAGASVESGVGAMEDLFNFVGCSNFKAFCKFVKDRDPGERYRYLSRFLQSQKPSEITPGYQALAMLCAEGYFDLILTTNLDPLLDDALASARLWRKDYLLLVNQVVRPNWLARLVRERSPRVKVIKLHGDLFHRCMAWTPWEMDQFVKQISGQLRQALSGRDILVVGHSLKDSRIQKLILQTGQTIWYTHPKQVPYFLAKNSKVRAVVGPKSSFERLFVELAKGLGFAQPKVAVPGRPVEMREPTKLAEGAQTVDDLMASVLALALDGGDLACTAFVLARPRVIIADGYAARDLVRSGRVTVVASDGRRFKARLTQRDISHKFGPFIFEVPKNLRVPGLRLDATRPKKKLFVHICVAAGERVGVSSGSVHTGREEQVKIDPVGQVGRVIALQCITKEGASGAPVTDSSLAVRGYIVAGATERPPSYMYPAYRWAKVIERKPRQRATSSR